MGCYHSMCADAHKGRPPNSMHGVLLGELGRWKASLDLLEREGQKQARKKLKHATPSIREVEPGGTEDKQKEELPEQKRAGLKMSYMDVRKMFKRSKQEAGAAVEGKETPKAEAESSGSSRFSSLFSTQGSSLERSGRGDLLQSMASGELMMSSEPEAVRKKLLMPPNERQRQETLDILHIVGTSQDDPYYNNIVNLAAEMFACPYAAIGILDNHRLWVKAMHSSSGTKFSEVPRDSSVSAHMLLSEKREVLVVEDIKEDARFHDLKLAISGPRFFACAPIYAPNGYQLGTLSLCDTKPRKLDAGSFATLINLAETAARSLLKEARFKPEDLPPPADETSPPQTVLSPAALGLNSVESVPSITVKTMRRLESSKESAAKTKIRSVNIEETGIMICDASKGVPQVMFVSEVWSQFTGVPFEEACTKSLWDLFAIPVGRDAVLECVNQAAGQHKDLETMAQLRIGSQARLRLSFRSAAGNLDQFMPLVGVPSFIQFSQRKDLRCFFVTVRRPSERAPSSVASSLSDADSDVIPCIVEQPTDAFKAASTKGEPWVGRLIDRAWSNRNKEWKSPEVRVPSVDLKLREFQAPKSRVTSPTPSQPGSRPGSPLQTSMPRQKPPTGPPTEVELRMQEAAEKNVVAPATPPKADFKRADSVPLPYNIELFKSVTLGPLLGRGSYGKVHRGIWSGKQIAVKIIETFHEGTLAGEVVDLPEARLLEEVVHPNIIQTYKHGTRHKRTTSSAKALNPDFGGASGSILETWLLLEYCNKGTLQDANDRGWFRTEPSRQKGKPDMGIILATALEMAEGLEHLHSQGILHGDLSPGNVLLADNPSAAHGFTVKIADFGLSRDFASKTIHTKTFGTVTHMPPELLEQGTLTAAADIYSLGVLLWSMYTGVPAWQGLRRTQVLFKVTALKASLQIPPGCPPVLKDLLERCMKREHKERPSSATLASELRLLMALAQEGVDMDQYQPSTAATSSGLPGGSKMWRAVSLAKQPVAAVPEEAANVSAATADEEGRSAVETKSFLKMPSGRRPAFSPEGTQLEVV